MEFELTKEDIATLRRLRSQGCAVAVFVPDELTHSNTHRVEDAMIEAGWRQINFDTPAGAPISL